MKICPNCAGFLIHDYETSRIVCSDCKRIIYDKNMTFNNKITLEITSMLKDAAKEAMRKQKSP